MRFAPVGARAIGKAIGQFQLVAQMLADSALEINAARLALWQTALDIDAGRAPRTRICLVKLQAAETLGRVVDRAVQVFGGMGFCKDLPIERYDCDARIYRFFGGTSKIHRTVMGPR